MHSDNNQIILKNMLIELLEKLNNGYEFFRDDIELNYKQIQPFIDLLYTIEDFPVDDSDENIYCFIKSERKAFDKYHIQDIADIVIDYETKKDNLKNPSSIIKDYVKNKSHNSKKIDLIVLDYANKKNCSDSKNIKQLILENATKERKYSEEVLTEKILKYATDIRYSKDIAEIITDIEKYKNFSAEIHDIIKESKLPRRDDKVYQIISSYEPYEITHCISYEMAIRNNEVLAILEKIKILTILSKDLFKADMLYKNDITVSNIKKVELAKKLEALQVSIDIDYENFDLTQAFSKIICAITEYRVLLEEDYYMIYDCKEIIPEGMENVFKEPNHYETDIELNQYMNKAIEESIKNAYDSSPRYQDNYTVKDGYATYQAGYKYSKEYDINKIFPNFKRPMREFNQVQVAFNMSLPKNEIIAYIEKIKDDYDNKNTSYKTLNQLLYEDDIRIEDKLNRQEKEKYADNFFIYDYYTRSDEEHGKKLESIQKKLSQYHGMKIVKKQNTYVIINYDEALIKMNTPKTKTTSNSFADIAKSFKEQDHIIHYLETISTIEDRYVALKNAIDNKKYKKLMNHE